MKHEDDSNQFGRLLIAAKAKHSFIRRAADLAAHMDVDQQVLTNWKKRGIPSNKIYDLSDRYSCNPRWLATGQGSINEQDIQKPFAIDLTKATLEKANHIKEVIEMDNEEFRTQERVFKAVVKSTKTRKKQDE